jgi:ribulose-phosphate 3-epimerase
MENVAEIAAAGCDIVVAGSSIFGAPDAAAAVEKMKRLAGQSQLLRA